MDGGPGPRRRALERRSVGAARFFLSWRRFSVGGRVPNNSLEGWCGAFERKFQFAFLVASSGHQCDGELLKDDHAVGADRYFFCLGSRRFSELAGYPPTI